jgi:hypothetical protein
MLLDLLHRIGLVRDEERDPFVLGAWQRTPHPNRRSTALSGLVFLALSLLLD